MPAPLYIAYAPKDHALLDQLLLHLSGLQRAGLVTIWSDREIQAGEDADQQKAAALQKAKIILLLISADFLADQNIYEQEVKPAMALQQSGKAKVIPLLLRECIWEYESFATLPVLPVNKAPVTSDVWESTDDAFAEIVKHIASLLKDYQNEKKQKATIINGQYTDPRDGQSYAVQEFQGKIWMTQSLHFATPDGYWDNGQKHGGLYTWQAAQTACPPGWRLASDADWQSLIDFYGNTYLAYKHLLVGGDSALKMTNGGKWSAQSNQLVLRETCGFYWSSGEVNYEQGIYYMFDDGMASLRRIGVDKKTGASVRCILED